MTRKAALAFGIGASFLLAAGAASAAGTCATEVQALQQQLGMTDSANARTGPTEPGVQQPSPSASADTDSMTTGSSDQIASGGTSTGSDGNSNVTNNENSGANATIGPNDPGVQQPAPESNASTSGSSSSSTGPTTGTTTGTSTETTTTVDSGTSTGSDGNSNVTNNENSGANATIGPNDPGVQQPGNAEMSATADTDTSTGSSSTMTGSTGTVTETSRVGEMNTAAGGRAAAIAALKKAQLYADAGEEDACMTELSTAKQHMGVQ